MRKLYPELKTTENDSHLFVSPTECWNTHNSVTAQCIIRDHGGGGGGGGGGGCKSCGYFINSSKGFDVYMHQQTRPSLEQKNRVGTKPLSKPLLGQHKSPIGIKFQWNFNETIFTRKWIWKRHLQQTFNLGKHIVYRKRISLVGSNLPLNFSGHLTKCGMTLFVKWPLGVK